jgi:hypothetical protein
MAKNNRDEFTEKTKLQIAKRAGWLCSDPFCRAPTIGATSDGENEINGGTASHICAAASGGPRYDPKMTREERRSASNGIWMCKLHGSSVDSHDPKFTVELLRQWKAQAQEDSWRRVLYNDVPHGPVAISEDELIARLRASAAADLEVFRRSDKWPSTAVALTLEVKGLDESVSTSALATALNTLGDLILVAQPGMGKTTTIFQIAEGVLANGCASPIIVPLGDWAADGASLLELILKRPAFRGKISEADLRAVAAKPGVILLLDGWNELDSTARQRATVQVKRLQAELPELGLLISTRKQALDVPFDGTRVDIKPLNETQQLDIAKALRGNAGASMVDQAWRTAGVRELVTIPLYLTALLALPEGEPFPTTKEEVLRRFVAMHENDTMRAEALLPLTHNFHQRFLEDLATTATHTANTTITEVIAYASVFETDDALVVEKQITKKPQPKVVLDALVDHHVLMRAGNPAGYAFQHQQFQEWSASHGVERLMLASASNAASNDELRADVLNQPAWEEAILFACERLARGDQNQQEACGTSILAAFEVDPILAAEMIFRSTDAVWARVEPTIQKLIRRWHTPGKVDRALRFMINSGRPEFFDRVWPLITHENDQISLSALRAGRRFRPSLLGSDAAKRIAALPAKIREIILHEIALNSGMDGLDLATAIAKDDPDPEVKATAVDALSFRRADRHVAEVLRHADEKTFDLVARKDLADEVDDDMVKQGLDAARERQRKEGVSAYDRLRTIAYARGDDDRSSELIAIISEMEIDKNQDPVVGLIYEARKHYPRAVAQGMLQRVYEGRPVPYRAQELMAGAGLAVEDEILVDIALDGSRFDSRADAAASVLGPRAVRRLIDKMLETKNLIRDTDGKYNKAAGDLYHLIHNRIGQTQSASLLAAIGVRSPYAENEEIAGFADLISRHRNGDIDPGQPFEPAALATIVGFAEDWGNRFLASNTATRTQLASIASLVGRARSSSLLPLLKRLLDEELRLWRAFKEQAAAENYRRGEALDEARTGWTLQYQHAFDAIGGADTAMLMDQYLLDEDFGQPAALVLASQWRAANEPSDSKRWISGPDFSRVAEKRAARASDSTASSAEADAIFSAVERLVRADTADAKRKLAVELAIVGAALPHGQRDQTITAVLALAERRQRSALLNSLVLSGEIIDIEMVIQGLDDMFEAAKKEPWILTERWEFQDLLRLLPFTNRPGEALKVLRGLPGAQRTLDGIEGMLASFAVAPGDDAENVLFQLAEAYPGLYKNRAWWDAVVNRATVSAAKRIVDLTADGVFIGAGGIDHWQMTRHIAGLIGQYPDLRMHVYDLLGNGLTSPGLQLLAQAIAENPDTDGLLLLVRCEIDQKRSFTSWRTIESVVTQHVPSESWEGAYEVVGVPATELRRKLLAMTTDGGANDPAARCLNLIDKLRDERGRPETEPRHPDLGSGKTWPIMAPDSDATEQG